jgi:CO/xanthine dehydrogenase FAD-binding subunit
MRADPRSYEIRSPRDLREALDLLAADPGLRLLAGGTDLMVLYAAGKLPAARMLDLWGIDALRGITVRDDEVALGALTTYTEVQEHPVLRAEFPMLVQAASETGGWAIQNRGTLGGNIANASPAADSPPALLAYGASVELIAAQGARTVPYERFHTGYKQTVLAPGELIGRVLLPRHQAGGRRHYYRKVGPRRAQAISKVCFAGCADLDAAGAPRAVRIALGGVAPVVVRCPRTEALLAQGERDEAALRASLVGEISPIDDVRSSARYRRAVAQNLLGGFLAGLRAE